MNLESTRLCAKYNSQLLLGNRYRAVNILGQGGKLVLVDFGAAKEALASEKSQVGTIIGSLSYIAPEQAAGKAHFASDLYRLGTTCLHLLTNIEPIDLFDTVEGEWNWRSHLEDNSIDYELSRILDKLVEGATRRRFQSAEEVIDALSGKMMVPEITRPTVDLPPRSVAFVLIPLSPPASPASPASDNRGRLNE